MIGQSEVSQEDDSRERAKARNRAWVMHHPLSAVILFTAFVAGDIWLRFSGSGQHLSTEGFLLTLGVIVVAGVALARFKIRSGNRRAIISRD
jgi:hypothetical protein